MDPFTDNIDSWLDEDIEYQATWIYDRLCNMGFTCLRATHRQAGSYETVKRKVHQIKAERQRNRARATFHSSMNFWKKRLPARSSVA